MTLRSRLPILLSELLSKGVKINFEPRFGNELLVIVDHKQLGVLDHDHLMLLEGEHGGNTIRIEEYLSRVLEKLNERT